MTKLRLGIFATAKRSGYEESTRHTKRSTKHPPIHPMTPQGPISSSRAQRSDPWHVLPLARCHQTHSDTRMSSHSPLAAPPSNNAQAIAPGSSHQRHSRATAKSSGKPRDTPHQLTVTRGSANTPAASPRTVAKSHGTSPNQPSARAQQSDPARAAKPTPHPKPTTSLTKPQRSPIPSRQPASQPHSPPASRFRRCNSASFCPILISSPLGTGW